MIVDHQALAQLKEERQEFFLPFYLEIVARHPLGVESATVKQIAREEIIKRFEFDPFDGSLTGNNESTGDSRASQWANNLVSNRVLDAYMIVVRGGRTMLYPLSELSNPTLSEQPAPGGRDLNEALRDAADTRSPSVSVAKTKQYLRSPALAEYVRKQAGHRCIIGSPDCVTFIGRDGRPYVEVHHMVPMAEQHRTQFNLDRTANVVAICPACHLKLHQGSDAEAEATLRALLHAYHASRGVSLSDALGRCDLGCDLGDLLSYYSPSLATTT